MGAWIAPVSLQLPAVPEAAPAPAVTAAPKVSAAAAVAAPRPEHTASSVAFTPAAMTALIDAQENLAQGATPAVRDESVRGIDRVMARLKTSPPEVTPMALRMLNIVRQQLRNANNPGGPGIKV